MIRYLTLFFVIVLTLLLAQQALAQGDDMPEQPLIPQVHTVQEGENLTIIAEQYGLTVEEILQVNGLSNGDLLALGQELIIPGGEGEAVATVYTVQAGDSIAGIAAIFNTDETAVLEANRLVLQNPTLTLGQQVTVVSRTGSALPQPVRGRPHVVRAGETLLTIAVEHGLSSAEIVTLNQLDYPYTLFEEQRLRLPSETAVYRDLPGGWIDLQIRSLPITQGSTFSIYVEHVDDGQPVADFAGQMIPFTPQGDGFVGLVGLDAFSDVGNMPLTLSGVGAESWQPLVQQISILSSGYGTQQISIDGERAALLAPEVRAEEDALLAPFFSNFTPEQYWDGAFQFPITTTFVTAGYGDGRSYNGGPVEIFHTGVDFGAVVGTPVLAPAAGTVVFSDLINLRGNVVIIDHGLGVMTGYFHLDERQVTVGDQLAQGDPLGTLGNTGLSSGPHLHWDLRIRNVAVDARQWTETTFP